MSEGLRSLPGVDRVIGALAGIGPEPVIARAARIVIDEARRSVVAGSAAPSFEEIVARTRAEVAAGRGLRSVVNATGVLIHTNLGRSPLGDAQLSAVARLAAGYSNLEFDLGSGTRGSRYGHARRDLTTLTGAESALVVNNNAAAVLLVLTALCGGREVVISRGELVEIGGEFRIPDVMTASGARLVEVGTTNRTHIGDYERALTPDTAAILKVHPSNYRVVGFTSAVPGRELARLARGRGVCFIHDVGSGLVEAPPSARAGWAATEPSIRSALEDGADLVTFSGDKLFGGPQAGVIVGRADLIARLQRHPLMRTLRVDKVTLAALQATVDAYLRGAWKEIPLWAMALADEEELEARAVSLAGALSSAGGVPEGYKVEATRVMSVMGGGSTPGSQIPSWGVTIADGPVGASEILRRLRSFDPPVIARVADDRVIVDLRTVLSAQDEWLRAALLSALGVEASSN